MTTKIKTYYHRMYRVNTIQQGGAFNDFWKMFRAVVMEYDIQASELKFESISGYEKEQTTLEYDYSRFKEDMKK